MQIFWIVLKNLQKLWNLIKRRAAMFGKLRYVRDWRVWVGVGAAVFTVVFWALPVFAAKAPGQLGYDIKRFEESLAANLAPTAGMRKSLRLDFAQRRLDEAAYLATHAVQNDLADEAKTVETITELLDDFETTYATRNEQLNRQLSQNQNMSSDSAKAARQKAVNAYTSAQLLRVQAPDAAQLVVLTSIDAVQQNLAALSDALGATPLSASDISQLSHLISVGVLSKKDVDNFIDNATSNRSLHTKITELIDADKLPSDMIYALHQDLIKQLAPDKAAAFEAVAEFGQMQRISATIQASRPSAAQQEAIQEFLKNYQVGQALPNSEIRPFLAPIVYGMALTGQMQANLPALNDVHLWGDKQALFDSWQGTLASDQKNLASLYQRLMVQAENQPRLHTRSLARVQQELVGGQQANVAYLVMPPGWGADMLPELSQQMGVEIAEAKFIEANPDTNQQLVRLISTQQELQSSLDNIKQTNSSLTTKLETHVNNFTGGPGQITILKETLETLKETQTNTINELQTQIDTITEARTTLETTIQTVRSEQLTSITELRLEAANNTKELTETVRAELSSQLTVIEQQSQTLIEALQARIDGLDSDQAQLRNELITSIQTIELNQSEFASYVQAQLDTGKAVADQLQQTVQNVETTIAAQQVDLTNLSADTGALSSLVQEVKTTSETRADQLQGHLNDLAIDQETVLNSIATLEDQQAAELAQLTSQVSQLSILQVEAQVSLDDLAQQQVTAQMSIDALSGDLAGLELALASNQEAYDSLQVEVAAQQSELASW